MNRTHYHPNFTLNPDGQTFHVVFFMIGYLQWFTGFLYDFLSF